jgi:hypothetical protein
MPGQNGIELLENVELRAAQAVANELFHAAGIDRAIVGGCGWGALFVHSGCLVE